MPTKKKRAPNPRPLYAPSPEAAELAWQRLSDPDAWHGRLAAALEKAGSMRRAAADLKVSLGVIQRAIRDDPRLEQYLTKSPGNPQFGKNYDGPKRGKDKRKRKRRTSSLKS